MKKTGSKSKSSAKRIELENLKKRVERRKKMSSVLTQVFAVVMIAGFLLSTISMMFLGVFSF